MTRFEIQGTTLKLKERARIDNVMRKHEYTTLGTISKDRIKKVFENPVTAIAYEFNDYTEIPFIEFDKKDIIRALDFWIANRIQLNERRLFLKGNLRDVDEEELRKLIMTRKFIDGQPNDAKFARVVEENDDRYNESKIETWTVEFVRLYKRTIAVKKPTQVNPHHVNEWRRMTNFREDGVRFDFSGIGTSSTDDGVSITLHGGRHDETDEQMARRLYNDGYPWIYSSNPHDWRIRANDNAIVGPDGRVIRINSTELIYGSFENASSGLEGHRRVWDDRQRGNVMVQEPWHGANRDVSTWMVRPMRNDQTRFRVVDNHGVTVAEGFTNVSQAEAYITTHRNNISSSTAMIDLHTSGLITREELREAFRVPIPTNHTNDFYYDHAPTGRYYHLSNGNVQTNLTPTQITALSLQIGRQLPLPEIRNDPTSPTYDPNVPITNNFANLSIHELYNTVFEGMICSETSQTGLSAGTAGHITARLRLNNGLVDIDAEILTTSIGLDSIPHTMRSFRVNLLSNNHIQIDGRTYDMVDYTVRETINFTNIPEGIARRFNNFMLTRVERERERYKLELESLDGRVQIENICLRRTTAANQLMDRIGLRMNVNLTFIDYRVGINERMFEHQSGERPVVIYRANHAV